MVFRVPASSRPQRLTVPLLSWVGAALLGACGPSFEVLAEGDLRFAHCDRLDLDPEISPSHRLHCWREWRRTYTYGQTRDRVEYAASRHYALAVAPTLPTDDILQQTAPGGGFRQHLISAPAPTTMFAPPPNTMPEAEDAGTAVLLDGGSKQIRIRPPGHECTDDCVKGWKSCRETCTGKACDACDTSHGACMTSCFADAGVR